MLKDFNKASVATILMLLMVLYFAAPSSFSQSMRADLITNIPFAFTVANQVLPPGRYTVTAVSQSYVRIHAPRIPGILVLTHSAESETPVGVGKLIFHRYGDAYFLAEVRAPDKSIGRQLFSSEGEKEFAKRARSRSHGLMLAQQMNHASQLEEIEIIAE